MKDNLYENLDMEDYLDLHGIEYRHSSGSSGEQLQLRECPSCGDDKWRTYLNAENGYGNCFKCNAGYNKWKFIKAHLGTENSQEVRKHVERSLKDLGWRPKKERTKAAKVEVPTDVKLPFSMPLPTTDGQNALYLYDRGFNNEITARFRLRLCLNGGYNYIKEDGSPGYMKFDDRIIIPVHDIDGKLVTFQGRDMTGLSEKKYLFPPRLPGTGRYLLNGDECMERQSKHVVMGEGIFDVMAIAQAIADDASLAMCGVVGSFGKSLSDAKGGDSQVSAFLKLKEVGMEMVTIMWDGTPDAFKSALVAAERLIKHGIIVNIALLPAGKDPNEVKPIVVRQAIATAMKFTKMNAVRWRMNNPYDPDSVPAKAK